MPVDYTTIIKSIISQQELIIGPVAIEEANRVEGLKIDPSGTVILSADGKSILEKLVSQYAALFGRVSVEVCKEAAVRAGGHGAGLDLPEILK